jgi:hypothetical protein
MSMAASIAAARLQHGSDRQRTPVLLSSQDSIRVNNAVRAMDSGALRLQPGATIEPLTSTGAEVPLEGEARKDFANHHTFEVPREEADGVDTVHRFFIRPDESLTTMNETLKRMALGKEKKARASGAMPAQYRSILQQDDFASRPRLPPPGRRADAGVSISNEGGFQSYPDLLDFADFLEHAPPPGQSWTANQGAANGLRQGQRLPDRSSPPFELNAHGISELGDKDSIAGRRSCHALHRIASAAINEIERSAHCGRTNLQSLHAANAWLNVNRADDTNLMHVHCNERWSAIYYVAASPSSDLSLDGRLLFRGGSKRKLPAHMQSSSPIASHTYMTVAPIPGSLWLFPGSMPHRVLGMLGAKGARAEGSRGMWPPRISVAMNFLDAIPPNAG